LADSGLRFVCDAMLGGLARWLRAAGYSAAFDVHAADGALVRKALDEGLCLLTSDSGIMERYAVAQGLIRCVFVPRNAPPTEQLAHVMAALGLQLREPRCMVCDGVLAPMAAQDARDHVPPKVRRRQMCFFRCRACGKVYWHGTHWERIRRRLGRARDRAAALEDGLGPE